MATITHLGVHGRGLPARITSEEEALSVAAKATEIFAVISPDAVGEWLARSGLLAISVPAELGGIDVSNVVLAEIVSAFARASAEAATALTAHFAALELLRGGGTEDQRRAVFDRARQGQRFALARLPTDLQVQLTDVTVEIGKAEEAAALPPDWRIICLQSLQDSPVAMMLARTGTVREDVERSPLGAFIGKTSAPHVDAMLALQQDALLLSTALSRLLTAATVLGRCESELSALISPDQGADDVVDRAERAGLLAVRIETLRGIAHRCGALFDRAQVSPTTQAIEEACRVSTILDVVIRETGLPCPSGEDRAALRAVGNSVLFGGR
ncbi:acyl-CoA dehydrogenase-like protein [Ciceribacter lividus]|uniref:Acyl-CoA dehydrogenase-like protein n=1 Tax=Ciceribacter lividus TaxID=1197950 RepID=A0A6I7HKW9_9HYPH|nr:acyl-CoA dehydrogenase family protein [Ciceribacter lividus]RCW22541.1 acyl-CoA dehydrogenase-like protein [Ciceribacter lividus]